MAKKKNKWKYKYVSEEKFQEYENMSEEELVDSLKKQSAYHKQCIREKKGSETLKELRAEINEYKKKWADSNPEAMADIEGLKEQIKEIEAKRDEKIADDLEEKKDLEGGFRDAINGAQEHINVMVDLLRKKS